MDMRHIHYSYAKMRETNRSYQLRTGQMKLSVRKIEPVQYVDSKNVVYRELPRYPILGRVYKFGDGFVKCEVNKSNCGNLKCVLFNEECRNYVSCTASARSDKTNIFLAPYNA